MEQGDLNKAHYKIWGKNPEISLSKEHTKLSIQFAIEVLEEMVETKDMDYLYSQAINDTALMNTYNKIQELKQYLDEKV